MKPYSTPVIAILDDDDSIRTVLRQAFIRLKYTVLSTDKASQLYQWVCKGKVDLIITDILMPDINGFELIVKLKTHNAQLPIIVMSALSTLSTALAAEENHVFEYFPKPFDLEAVIGAVKRALNNHEKQAYDFGSTVKEEQLPLIGKSIVMQELYRSIARLTTSDLTVIITGESGTGKELVARILHDHGLRRNGPFISMNMAVFSEKWIERELSAYQLVLQQKNQEHMRQTERGTLFLDEIGDMPIEIQSHFLAILDKKTSLDIQGDKQRIIATSRKNLFDLVKTGKFREDLFYRLNIVALHLPPLRERVEDIPLLIQHFLKDDPEIIQFSSEAMECLCRYDWPGNIRELKNIITHLTVLYPHQIVRVEFIRKILQNSSFSDKSDRMGGDLPLSKLIEKHLHRYFLENRGQPVCNLYEKVIAEIEFPLLKLTLAETEGNQMKTATMLGINRNTLRKKLKSFNLLGTSKKGRDPSCNEKTILGD